jgi:hypothetical protein
MLQGVGNGVALGWVADRADPHARVPVALVIDGEIVAEGLADVARADLLEADLGDGAHGFLLELPQRLQTPGRRSIVVLVSSERTPLPTAPSFWQKPSPNGSWSDVVFVPGGGLSASVPPPPATEEERRAVTAAGWLLSVDEEEDHTAPGDGELDGLVALLHANAQRCAELGILYIPALVPRKRDVIAPAPSPARAWVARLNARLRDVDEVALIDLLGVLRDGAARHGSAYHRTDADWNDRGAFYVARALLKEAHQRIPALRPPALAELRVRAVPGYLGTLADAPKLELAGGELRPCDPHVDAELGVSIDAGPLRALRMPVEQTLAQAGSVHVRVYATADQDQEARVAVLGDAAALSLLPWLAERAGRTTFFWTRELPSAQLEIELPRVVFHLLRETDLLDAREPDPLDVRETDLLGGSPAENGGAAAAVAKPIQESARVEPARAGASLLELSARALHAAISTARGAPRDARAALSVHARTLVLVGLLSALSWPFTYVKGGAGLDNSWVVGLSFAVAHGLAFGRQVIFTYGPLGFALNPAAITPGTFLAGEVLGGLIQVALVAVLLANLRRRMNLLTASVLTLLAASLIGWLEAEPLSAIAFGLVALTLMAPATRRERAFRRLALGGGALAAFALLVKLNDGVATGAILAIGLCASDWRRRDLGRAGASMLGTLLVLWLALGEPPGALPGYLRNGYDVVTGYVEAMGHNTTGVAIQWQLLLVLGSAVTLALGASRALATERRRRGAALAGAVLVVHYFVAREMFVRYDTGHVAFMALLAAIALLIPWTAAQRGMGIALAALLAVASFAVLARPVDQIVNPLNDAHHLLSQAGEVLSPGALIAQGRADVRRDDSLPAAMAASLRGHCVNTEPDEIAAVWAHPKWRWCPLPVFQSYTAYTPRLDRLNAAAYADPRHGPDRVLRQVDQAIDTRNPIWESPAAMLSLLCHFTEVAHSGEWQTLARVPNRCGAPRPLETIHSSLGATIALPSPPPGAVLVAAIEGVQVAGWERLETLFTRARARFVTVNDTSALRFRVPPGTAGDGLVLAVPYGSDYAAPFNLNMDPRTLRVDVEGHGSGAIAVRLYAVPIH